MRKRDSEPERLPECSFISFLDYYRGTLDRIFSKELRNYSESILTFYAQKVYNEWEAKYTWSWSYDEETVSKLALRIARSS